MQATCCVCGLDRDCTEAISVTEDMRKAYPKYNFPDILYYCKPCWRLISDPEKGARLLSQFFQATLSSRGAKNANVQADKLYEFLVEKAKNTPNA